MNIYQNLRFVYRGYRYRFKLDRHEIKYMRQNLHPGDTAIDVGAHKGGYIYWMRKCVGKGGSCFAFEPQPILTEYLRSTCRSMGYLNVQVEGMALSSQPGRAKLHIPTTGGTSPGARLKNVPRESGDTLPKGRDPLVDITTLDLYLEGLEVCPKLIKIDVEGHEANVIEGGRKLLQNYRPILMIECEERHIDGPVTTVFDQILNHGYKGFFFEKGIKIDIGNFDPSRHQVRSSARKPGYKYPYINNFIFEPI